MTSSDGSFLGLAKQTQKGTPNTTDADFKYLLFNEGGVSPNNVVLPLDPEVGGGAMLRDLKKMGVMSGGGLNLVFRPNTLGNFLQGALGNVRTLLKNSPAAVHAALALTGTTQVGVSTGITPPPSPCKLVVKGHQAGGSLAGNVVIHGNVAAAPDTETVALNGNFAVMTTKVFESVTAIDYPAKVTTGDTVSVGITYTGVYEHNFYLGSDQFSAPYYTVRSSPGGMWGESFQDCRLNALGLEFRGANYLRGTVGIAGGLPAKAATTTWNALDQVDSGPQFISPVSSIAVPSSTPMTVLGGGFSCGMAIPLDEQWVVGSYSPDAFDIVSRAFALNFAVKITDAALYSKMMYDPAGGNAWVASLFREADIKLEMKSDAEIAAGHNYMLKIEANGQSGTNANVVWSASPVGLRAGRQVILNVSGVFLADPLAGEPILVTLHNNVASY